MSKTLLRIDTSARRTGSVSRQLTDAIIEKLSPETVLTRDLADALPQIDETWVGANFTAPDERSDEQRAKLALSDTLIVKNSLTLFQKAQTNIKHHSGVPSEQR